MKVEEIIQRFGLVPVAGKGGLDREVQGGYCGDLLSDVMANAGDGALWLTIQSHKNIVGVSVLREVAAVVLVNGREPDEDTKAKADEEGIPILTTGMSAFETAGLLYKAGVGRTQE
ncbi:MAG: serine kinase [Deltaproteobacteria bacterium]|nr:serine kinase [Deltaproteobacteria bacterium]